MSIDTKSESYQWEYRAAVGCAALLAGLGVAASQADALGLTRQLLGILAVITAMLGVVAAALPSVRQRPGKKPKPPVTEE